MLRFTPLIFAALLVSSCSFSQSADWSHDYDVKFYKLDIEVSDKNTSVKGYTEILSQILRRELKVFTIQLTADATVDSVCINGVRADFTHDDNLIRIFGAFKQDSLYTVRIDYAVHKYYTGLFSPVSHETDYETDTEVTWSLSEPDNAFRWFPCKQYLPDKADSAYIFLTVPARCKAGSQGTLTAVVPLPDGKTRYEWKTRYPVAYYLLSFAVADYMEYNTFAHIGEDTLLIQNYIYNSQEYFAANKPWLDTVAAMVEFFSELYIPYPFVREKYGHCVAPVGGGMEHQTMTTIMGFNFTIVVHELAHQWFGDLVTCASFQDVWINEAFASYSEYLVFERFAPEQAAQWLHSANRMATALPDGSVFIPAAEVANEYRVFDYNLTYMKGAMVVHLLRRLIDDDAKFFALLRGFLQKYLYATASVIDFKMYAEQYTGLDLTRFFKQWYYGKGYPVFSLFWQNTDKKCRIAIEHRGSSADNPLFVCDVDLKISLSNGSDTLVKVPIRSKNEVKEFYFNSPVTDVIFDPYYNTIRKIEFTGKDN